MAVRLTFVFFQIWKSRFKISKSTSNDSFSSFHYFSTRISSTYHIKMISPLALICLWIQIEERVSSSIWSNGSHDLSRCSFWLKCSFNFILKINRWISLKFFSTVPLWFIFLHKKFEVDLSSSFHELALRIGFFVARSCHWSMHPSQISCISCFLVEQCCGCQISCFIIFYHLFRTIRAYFDYLLSLENRLNQFFHKFKFWDFLLFPLKKMQNCLKLLELVRICQIMY